MEKEIGNRLKQVRKERGYTQKKLAELACVSPGVIANIEYSRARASDITVKVICDILDIKKEWLLTGEGEKHNTHKNDELAVLLAEVLLSEDDRVRRMASALIKLSDEELDAMESMVNLLLKNKESV